MLPDVAATPDIPGHRITDIIGRGGFAARGDGSPPRPRRCRRHGHRSRGGLRRASAIAWRPGGAGTGGIQGAVLVQRRIDRRLAGANVLAVTTVTKFADGPGVPYASHYALDAAGNDGAFVSAPRTLPVNPATPLNLSAANAFYLYVDGFGYPLYAAGYAATVTLASGSHMLSKTVPVASNAWNRVVVEVGSWSYRGHVTGISVSYTGIPSKAGLTTPWEPHFQIDDVGYTS